MLGPLSDAMGNDVCLPPEAMGNDVCLPPEAMIAIDVLSLAMCLEGVAGLRSDRVSIYEETWGSPSASQA